jgi:molecular chaperone DnaJ
MVSEDYYELLGIQRGADDAAIKAAYRRLAKECHPDRHNGCRDQEAKFKAINEAYDVLKDPQKRAAYDRFGKAAFQNGGGGHDPFGSAGFEGFSDIAAAQCGVFCDRRGAGHHAARGADLRYDLELSLEEAFSGIEKTITIEALSECQTCDGRGCTGLDRCTSACSTCGGMGKIRAQQGFFVVERGCPTCRGSGETISNPCATCEGESGIRGASSGDLYIFVHMKPHPIYAREGTSLIADCPISFTTAALGGSITLPGLDGHKVEIKIPTGVQSGEQLRHRGAGMSVLNGRGRGDLVARILVETPTRMTKEQKKLLEEFRATETGDECPAAKGFFSRVREFLGA